MNRPNGKILMRVGIALFAIGLTALIAGSLTGLMPMDQYPIEDWRQIVALWAPPIFTISLPLGTVAWLVGYLVFAISFLPAKADLESLDN